MTERRGNITVFTGPMFASKTTRLLSRIERESYRLAEDQIVLVKPLKDARHGVETVGTHKGSFRPATIVTELLNTVSFTDRVRVVAIDEGQFFDDIDQAALRWSDQGIHIYVACLDMDSSRKPWDNIARLLCLANTVEKCTAVCECGQDATLSFKKV